MSGQPNKEQIDQLRDTVTELRAVDLRVQFLASDIAAKKKEHLDKTEYRAVLQRRVTGFLHSMDVASNGNCGWEHRITQFLTLAFCGDEAK